MTTHIFDLKAGDIVVPPSGTIAVKLAGVEYLKGEWKVSRLVAYSSYYALHLVPVSYKGKISGGRPDHAEKAEIRSVKCNRMTEVERVASHMAITA